MTTVCFESGCLNLARYADGLCPTHHEQVRQGRAPRAASTEPYPTCAVSHCTIEANSRKSGALCEPHYQLKWRGIDPESRKIRNDSKRYDRVCAVDGCDRRAISKSLCTTHSRQARQGIIEVPAELGVRVNDPCLVEGCDRPYEAKGLCHTHYCQLRDGRPIADVRVWRKYTALHPCLVEGCEEPAVAKDLCTGHASRAGKYGLTGEQLALVLSASACENPGCSKPAEVIDHDHSTGEVRGHLCNGCNAALGFTGEDSRRLLGLIRYLESPPVPLRLAA